MEPKTEVQEQGRHFRRIQTQLLWILALMVFIGLASIFYAQVIRKVPEKELTQFWYIEIMLITSFVGVVGWAFGTSISSNKNGDALREAVARKPVG